MPFSRPDARAVVIEWVRELAPATILDVGVGSGTYWKLLSPVVDAAWTGVEIHGPYVRKYRLASKYDRLVLGDFLDAELTPHDLVILGDVLEHVAITRAQEMIDKAYGLGPTITVVPIDHFEQGPSHGNSHEAHLWHPTHETMLDMTDADEAWSNGRKGAYLRR